MSVTPARPLLSNPEIGLWPITLIIVVVVIAVPSAMLNAALGNVITLCALLLGGGSTAAKYSNRVGRG